MSQPLKSDDRTIQLDTRNGPANGGLNLDFLDLPDDPAATVPAPPPQSPPPAAGGPFAQPGMPAGVMPAPLPPAGGFPTGPAGGGSFPAPAQAAPGAAPPSDLSSLSVFRGGAATGTNAGGRLLKMGGLFIASFVVVGGLVFLFGTGDDANDFTASPPRAAGTAAGAPTMPEGEESLFDSIIAGVMEMLGLAEEAPPPPPVTLPVKAKTEKKVVDATPPPEEEVVENVDLDLRDPYRIIANSLDRNVISSANQSRRKISTTEEQGWTAGLTHKFPYQHYRSVEEMRAARPEGSERLLREALADGKLWVRMQAAFALAESGVELTTSEVAKAVGPRERRNLLNAYFKRFVRANNMAERYVLKFSLPLVPDGARIDILQGLVNAGDPDAGLYTIAATFDDSPRVRRWAGNLLARNPSVLLRMDEYRAFLDAWELTDAFRPSVVAPRAGTSPAAAAAGLASLGKGDRPVPPAEGSIGARNRLSGSRTGQAGHQGEVPVSAGAIPDSPVEFYRVNR